MEEEKRYRLTTIGDAVSAIMRKVPIYDSEERLIDPKYLDKKTGIGPRLHDDDDREKLRDRFLWMLCIEGCYTLTRVGSMQEEI